MHLHPNHEATTHSSDQPPRVAVLHPCASANASGASKLDDPRRTQQPPPTKPPASPDRASVLTHDHCLSNSNPPNINTTFKTKPPPPPLRSEHWSFDSSQFSHPWLEWSRFLGHISSAGNVYHANTIDNSFVAPVELSPQFLREAIACLAFTRERPNLLRLLTMRDIAVVVEHGTPFLFRDAEDSLRKMKSFVSNSDGSVMCGQVVEVSTSKTSKHGDAKCHFAGIDIFTAKKLEDIVPSFDKCNLYHLNHVLIFLDLCYVIPFFIIPLPPTTVAILLLSGSPCELY